MISKEITNYILMSFRIITELKGRNLPMKTEKFKKEFLEKIGRYILICILTFSAIAKMLYPGNFIKAMTNYRWRQNTAIT